MIIIIHKMIIILILNKSKIGGIVMFNKISSFIKKNIINKKAVQDIMNEDQDGAIAFEYIIILVIMAVAIFSAWNFLSEAVITKAQEIAEFIQNNGQTELGGGR